MPITHTTHINAPIQTVWDHLEDPDLQMHWMTGLVANEIVDGEKSEVGAKIRFVMLERGKEQTYDGVITACDEPRHLGVRFWGGSFGDDLQITADYHLTESADGTRLEYVSDFQGKKGLVMKLLGPVIALIGKAESKKMMRQLKAHAEQQATD